MCSVSPYQMAEWPMGALPPIIALKVVWAEVYSSRFPDRTRSLAIDGGGELVLRPTSHGIRASKVWLVDPTGRNTVWQVREQGRELSVVGRDAETGQMVHFLDSLNQDVSPYVYAAVGRLVGVLAKVEVQRPPTAPNAGCVSCKAFRVLPGADVVYGDADARVPSVSTWRMKDEGPWQVEQYWCSALQDHPPDIGRIVHMHNAVARRGHFAPVLPLHQAGEDCALYLPAKAGRPGGIPLWEVPAWYANEPCVEEQDGVRILRVRGAQWEIVLPVKAVGAHAKVDRDEPERQLPERITVMDPDSGEKVTYLLSKRGRPEMGVLSYEAPLARAALKTAPGEEFTVYAPDGAYRLVRVS